MGQQRPGSRRAFGVVEVYYGIPIPADLYARCVPDGIARPVLPAFAATVARANANLTKAGRQPLPANLTPHDLRRTFVSLLFAIGEDLPYVMDQVGHADSRMTTGVYMKVMRRDPGQKAALRALVDGGVWDAMGRETDSEASGGAPF